VHASVTSNLAPRKAELKPPDAQHRPAEHSKSVSAAAPQCRLEASSTNGLEHTHLFLAQSCLFTPAPSRLCADCGLYSHLSTPFAFTLALFSPPLPHSTQPLPHTCPTHPPASSLRLFHLHATSSSLIAFTIHFAVPFSPLSPPSVHITTQSVSSSIPCFVVLDPGCLLCTTSTVFCCDSPRPYQHAHVGASMPASVHTLLSAPAFLSSQPGPSSTRCFTAYCRLSFVNRRCLQQELTGEQKVQQASRRSRQPPNSAGRAGCAHTLLLC